MNMEATKYFTFIILISFGVNLIVTGVPLDKAENIDEDPSIVEDDDNSTAPNGTHKELYVIKAVTYEIGILADVSDNDTTTLNGSVSHQQVDFSFYDGESNDSYINLGDVPLPVQTNVSGEIVTGISPVQIGAVHNVSDILSALPFHGTIVNITEGKPSYVKISRHNLTNGQNNIKLNNGDNLSNPMLFEEITPKSSVNDDLKKNHNETEENEPENSPISSFFTNLF
ncbi:CLUMA_CG015822, isoform A [Clunio marinus]|uniref:CLUMA_CG015822, isoform A n=1 Tax=Clunio marinus TaxID=568069 RepID=A0A1J1IRT1_9DIPT|nr:CLUMA_CG015822, isoform A [Clunio marinus]